MTSSKFVKHVSLMKTTREGKNTFRLVSADERMRDFFDAWALQLAKKLKYRSVKTYCYAVCGFLNFIEEVQRQRGSLNIALMREALDCYESYLVFAQESESDLASSVAEVIGGGGLSGSSVETHFVALNHFIEASEGLRVALIDLEKSGYITSELTSKVPLTSSKYMSAPAQIKKAIKLNSWLGGCIAGGAQRIKRVGLSPVSKRSLIAHTDEYGGDDLAFPIDKGVELINSTTCLRDKTLWSFLAASGCRVSEALTILIDDIHINPESPDRKKVLIVDPTSRRDVLSKYLAESDIDMMGHKGRETQETYLIEPFASIFWNCLDMYVEREREKEKESHKPVGHRFLFRNLLNGGPIPLSYQTVYERFTLAGKKVTGRTYGFHSLRHMYGYYLRNYCPNPTNPNKFGFDDYQVKLYMGHRSVKSTQRYARQDALLLEATFSAMNMLRMRDPSFKSKNVAIKYLENQLFLLKQKSEATQYD